MGLLKRERDREDRPMQHQVMFNARTRAEAVAMFTRAHGYRPEPRNVMLLTAGWTIYYA